MIRRITMLVTAALLAMMTLGGAAAAFAAPRAAFTKVDHEECGSHNARRSLERLGG